MEGADWWRGPEGEGKEGGRREPAPPDPPPQAARRGAGRARRSMGEAGEEFQSESELRA